MKILTNDQGAITTITLHHPEKRNAFDTEMVQRMIELCNDAVQKGQRIIIINAQTDHGVFSAGHDLSELSSVQEIQQDPMFEMIELIGQLPIPVIAEVHGAVYAGALHLLMVCDLVYATQASTVVMTANKMGLPFSLRHYHQWLSVMGIHRVKELFFTADKMSADEAHYAGIFNGIFDTETALRTKIADVCDKILHCSQAGIANSKLQLNHLAGNVMLNYRETMQIEEARHNLLSSQEFQERLAALQAKLHHKK
jgi:methylmalonyl-CoA decarboxylase